MDEQTTLEVKRDFPANWHIASDYDPNNHLMQLQGRDYLNVANRLLWFLKDQRAFISSGLARVPYIIETKLVEQDREAGYAHFSTYIRDVLGNETTMYGSETKGDFKDYAEKASTKSMGRALLALGYGTAFAPEMDEGERVVDAPVERRRPAQIRQAPQRQQATQAPRKVELVRDESDPPFGTMIQSSAPPPATEQQRHAIERLCASLGEPVPSAPMTVEYARTFITQLSKRYDQTKSRPA
jgi:hypothetical protein